MISFILIQFLFSLFVITVCVFSAKFSAHRGPVGLMLYYWFPQVIILLIVTSVSVFFLGRDYPATKEKILKKGLRTIAVFFVLHFIFTFPVYRSLYGEIINGDNPIPTYYSYIDVFFSKKTFRINVHIFISGVIFSIFYLFLFVMNGKRFFTNGERWDNFYESTYLYYKSLLASVSLTFFLYLFIYFSSVLILSSFSINYEMPAFAIMYFFSNDWFFILLALSLLNFVQVKRGLTSLWMSGLVFLFLGASCYFITVVWEENKTILLLQKEISLKQSLLAWELSALGISYVLPAILYFFIVGVFFVFIRYRQVKKLIESV